MGQGPQAMVAVVAIRPVKVEQRQACNEWPRYQVNIRASSVRLTWTGIEQGRLKAQRATREHLELLRERWAPTAAYMEHIPRKEALHFANVHDPSKYRG